MLTNGRRCPNTALAASSYCGLTPHQALRRFRTNSVTVLVGLTQEEVGRLADPSLSDAQVADIVAKAPEPEEPEVVAEAEPAGEGGAEAGSESSEPGAEALAGAPVETEARTEDEPAA
jgi:hypothetical protein